MSHLLIKSWNSVIFYFIIAYLYAICTTSSHDRFWEFHSASHPNFYLIVLSSFVFRARRTISRQISLNPQKLLGIQIQELNEKIDNFNVELASVLKSLADMTLNIKTLESSNAALDILERRRKQWNELDHRKQSIVKKLKMLEAEVARKEKERNAASWSI